LERAAQSELLTSKDHSGNKDSSNDEISKTSCLHSSNTGYHSKNIANNKLIQRSSAELPVDLSTRSTGSPRRKKQRRKIKSPTTVKTTSEGDTRPITPPIQRTKRGSDEPMQ
jgi:hypothetical protein